MKKVSEVIMLALKNSEHIDARTIAPSAAATQVILTALSEAGYVVVPRTPTETMLRAGARAKHSRACDGGYEFAGRPQAEAAWYEMVDAAMLSAAEKE